MKIAIVAAMDKEMRLLVPLLEDEARVTVNGTVFHTGRIGRHEAVISKCGIGKVNAAVATLSLIDTFHPDLVVNSGVAGGTGAAGILDVVVADEIAYHDVWCGPGTVPGQAAGFPARFLCELAAKVREQVPGAKGGLIASGDVFVSDPAVTARILELYTDAVAVDMESAAIAQVCALKNVPFLCIRVISDTPGAADNIAQYENFWEDAPAHTFAAVHALLKAL